MQLCDVTISIGPFCSKIFESLNSESACESTPATILTLEQESISMYHDVPQSIFSVKWMKYK